MNSAEVTAALTAAISDKRPRVIGLVGAWGVGKTHLWKDFVCSAKDTIVSSGFSKYSYVSLFGLSSQAAVKTTVLENLITTKDLSPSPVLNLKTAASQAKSRRYGIGLRVGKLLQKASDHIPYAGKASSEALQFVIDAYEFKAVQNSLVCFDDLERIAPPLTPAQVMGVIDTLARERDCKVFVIYSPENLQSDEDKKTVRIYREKLFDREIRLDPPFSYSISIAAEGQPAHIPIWLSERATLLGLKNIRVLSRIVDGFGHIQSHVPHMREEVAGTLFFSLCLLTYCHLVSKEGVPLLEELLELEWLTQNDKEDESTTTAFLRNYGWQQRQAWDKLLADYVRYGSCDWAALADIINSANAEQSLFLRSREISILWDEWKDRFTTIAEWDNFAERFAAAHIKNIDIVRVGELDSALWLLRDTGKSDLANKLFDCWKDRNGTKLEMVDISPFEETHKFSNDDLRKYCQDQFKSLPRPPKYVRDVLESMSAQSSWTRDDIHFLSTASPDDFTSAIKSAGLRKVRKALQVILDDPRPEGDYAKCKAVLIESLQRIASESPANLIRVKALGVRAPE